MSKLPKAIELQKPVVIQFFWRWHDKSNHLRRFWRSDWAFDDFYILAVEKFAVTNQILGEYGFKVTEVSGDD